MEMFNVRETKQLNYVLSKAAEPEDALYLEELHGFLFGLAITPEVIMPSEWFPMVFGEKGTMFADAQEAKTCMGHLMNAYNRMIKEFNIGKLRFPFDYENMDAVDFSLIEGWAYGFFLALTLRQAIWGMSEEYENKRDEDLPEDILDVISSCSVITALALPEEREKILERMSREQEEDDEKTEAFLYGMLPLCVETLMLHGAKLMETRIIAGIRRAEPVMLRTDEDRHDDLCPCGSSRKYKRCCGAH